MPYRTHITEVAMSRTVQLVLALLLVAGCSGGGPGTEGQDVSESPGVFETFVGQDGQWYFHLLAGNGEKVLGSESYVSLAGAENGIGSVKANGVDLGNYDLLEAADGEWYFNVEAQNHEVVATSETYVSKSNAERGEETVLGLIVRNVRTEAAETGGARFETLLGQDGQVYFHLRAANGEIMLQSEGYVALAGALNGIESVRTNGRIPERYEVLEASNGEQWYFRLKAANYEVIGRGEMYASEYNAQRAVDTLVALIASEAVADPG
jgi:uncharacterized protein YegP (UPF0339 family)